MLVVIGIIFILSLVIIHELGHFWAARRAKIEVEEFGIGFPPRAKVLTKKNGTEYTLNWLPLGGFVKLKGEHDSDTTKGSFGAASLIQKILVMVAGVGMNILTAVVLLSIISAVGVPKVIDNQFTVANDTKIVQHDVIAGLITSGSPAEKSGIVAGDVITDVYSEGYCFICDSVESQEQASLHNIDDSNDLRQTNEILAGQTVTVGITRDGKDDFIKVGLLSKEEVEASKSTSDPKGYLGVVPSDYIKQRSTWSAPIVGAGLTVQFFGETLKGLGGVVADLFHGNTTTAKEQVTGVVGIGYLLSELSNQGFMSILFLTAIISVSLAVMNVLPIPALDGGRLFVTLLFRVFKKPLSKETEERIHGTGFALLMLLFVLITVLDVQKFIIKK